MKLEIQGIALTRSQNGTETQLNYKQVSQFLVLHFVSISRVVLYLRNRKHVPCFYRVIETRVEVWENKKMLWANELQESAFSSSPKLSPVFL